MADIINLRLARKAKARDATTTAAAASRALHGRSKAEKALTRAERARRDALLDGAAIARDGGAGDEAK